MCINEEILLKYAYTYMCLFGGGGVCAGDVCVCTWKNNWKKWIDQNTENGFN